jgi:hypothetical protein
MVAFLLQTTSSEDLCSDVASWSVLHQEPLRLCHLLKDTWWSTSYTVVPLTARLSKAFFSSGMCSRSPRLRRLVGSASPQAVQGGLLSALETCPLTPALPFRRHLSRNPRKSVNGVSEGNLTVSSSARFPHTSVSSSLFPSAKSSSRFHSATFVMPCHQLFKDYLLICFSRTSIECSTVTWRNFPWE